MKTINDPSGIGFRTPFLDNRSASAGLLCHRCENLGNWFVSNWISSLDNKEGEAETEARTETETTPSESGSSRCCYTTYRHHLSWNALFESASQGRCSFCYQLALEAEERFMGGTIAHKIKHGKSTAFTAEIQIMDSEDVQVLFLCDRLKWSLFDVKVMPSTFLSWLRLVVMLAGLLLPRR